MAAGGPLDRCQYFRRVQRAWEALTSWSLQRAVRAGLPFDWSPSRETERQG